MYITIETTEFEDREVISRKSGAVFFTREQKALLFKDGEKYPDKFVHRLAFTENRMERDNSKPIPAGEYSIHPNSFTIDNFGGLRLGALHLEPLKQSNSLLSKVK